MASPPRRRRGEHADDHADRVRVWDRKGGRHDDEEAEERDAKLDEEPRHYCAWEGCFGLPWRPSDGWHFSCRARSRQQSRWLQGDS